MLYMNASKLTFLIHKTEIMRHIFVGMEKEALPPVLFDR